MPPKHIKLPGGRTVVLESVLLPNGNLVIPARDPVDRNKAIWKMVKPGTSDFKRWFSVHRKGADPRDNPDYKARVAAFRSTAEYKEWQQKQK